MNKTTVRNFVVLLVLIAGARSAFAETVPFMTFGPDAQRYKGDDDFRELVQIRVPRSVTQRLYLRVFDPDVGGAEDEPTGLWNTRTRFSLFGAGAAPLASGLASGDEPPRSDASALIDTAFGDNSSTDGQWHTLGSFMPEQGTAVDDEYRFTFVAEGLEGDDGNLFGLAVSSDPKANRLISGTSMSGQWPAIGIAPDSSREAEVRFVVPAGAKGLTIRNFDLDRARAVFHLPFARPVALSASADGRWREDRITFEPSAEDRPGAVVVRAGRTLRNNLVLEIRDQGGAPLAVRLPVRSFPRGSLPRLVVEHEIHSDCRTVQFDASGSSDEENDLIDYLWDFGDGQQGAGEQVEHRYGEPGAYSVALTVINDSGRVADRTRGLYPIKVNQAPEAVPGPRQVASPGERMEFDAGGSLDGDGEITRFLWTFGDGRQGKGSRTSHVYSEPGIYSVVLAVEDDGPGPCRIAEAATEVWINAAPTAVAGDDRSVAVGEVTSFDATRSLDADGTLNRFHWDLGDGGEATGASIEHAYAAPGHYLVTLTVEDDAAVANSRVTDQLRVFVNDPPLAALAGDMRGAVGETLTFDAFGSRDPDGSIIEYAWDFGDGHQATGDQVFHAFKRPGRYMVILRVRDDSGTDSEAGTAQLHVLINDPPVADAGDDQHLTASEVRFDGANSRDPDGEIRTWTWDFGDGTTGRGPSPTHVYAAPGRYLATLSVQDDSGTISADATDTMDLVINAKPVADAGPDRITAPGQPLAFDASGSFDPDGAVSDYRWDFGDGTMGEGVGIDHAFEAPGLYNVRLQVRDDSGHPGAVGFADALIRVNAPPVAIAGPDILAAPGQVVEFDAGASQDPDGEIMSYRWTFSDGQGMTDGPRVQRSFPEPGSYTADVEVTDDSGASNGRQRDRLAIRVNHPPTAVPGEPIHSCSPWIELDGSASRDADGDRLHFSWLLGEGRASAEGPRVLHRFTQAGHYPVVLAVDDRTGLNNAIHSSSTEVWVHSPPVAMAEGPALACAGEVILFTGANSYDPDGGRLLYHWDFGDGSEALISSPAKSYEHPGTYRVGLRVEDDSGLSCNSNLDRISVTVADAPVADAGDDRTTCANVPVTFDGSGSRDFDEVVNSYSWDFGDGSKGGGPNPTHLFTQAGEYRVTLTVTGDRIGDCPNRHSDEVRVQVLAAPQVAIEVPARAQQGAVIAFQATASDGEEAQAREGLSYHWDFGDGGSAEGQRVEHSFQDAGRYRIVLIARDPSGGECGQVRVEHAMQINAAPSAVAGEDRVTAPGETVMLDGSSSSDSDGAISRFEWDLGDGNKAEGVQILHRYDEPGIFVARLAVTDTSGLDGGSHEDTVVIRVNAPPRPQLELIPEVPCGGEDLILNATRSSDPDGTLQSWSWDLGNGATAQGAEVRHSYAEPGLYAAVLTISDDASATNSRARLVREIRVNRPPTAVIDPPAAGCPREPVRFDASASLDLDGRILDHRWIFGDGDEAAGAQVDHTYQAPGHYQVTLAVGDDSDSACNTARETVDVLINTAPTARIAVLKEPLFVGGAHDGVLFDASGSNDPDGGPLTYRWDFGDGTQGRGSTVIHDYEKPGRYRVKLEVRDGSRSGCGLGLDQVHIEVRKRVETGYRAGESSRTNASASGSSG